MLLKRLKGPSQSSVPTATEDADETLFVPLRTFASFYSGPDWLIGDIFKAGVWVGALLVILVIGVSCGLLPGPRPKKSKAPRRLVQLVPLIVFPAYATR